MICRDSDHTDRTSKTNFNALNWLIGIKVTTVFEIFIFCPKKFNFDFPRKLSIFWVKTSWKYCGFGLFSSWQLWKLGEKLVKMLGFCQSWILDSTPPKHWHYICLLFFRIKIVKRLGLKIAIHWKWGWSLGVKALISRTNKDDLPRLWPYGSDIKDQFQCIELTHRH